MFGSFIKIAAIDAQSVHTSPVGVDQLVFIRRLETNCRIVL